MKYFLVLFVLFICSCNSHYTGYNLGLNDSVVVVQPKVSLETTKPKSRYFFISFTSCEKGGRNGDIAGDIWFTSPDGFFNKVFTDSIIEDGLPKKRECYAGFIYNFIFEFKNEQEFIKFESEYKGSRDYTKKEPCCKSEPKMNWGPVEVIPTTLDTVISILDNNHG